MPFLLFPPIPMAKPSHRAVKRQRQLTCTANVANLQRNPCETLDAPVLSTEGHYNE